MNLWKPSEYHMPCPPATAKGATVLGPTTKMHLGPRPEFKNGFFGGKKCENRKKKWFLCSSEPDLEMIFLGQKIIWKSTTSSAWRTKKGHRFWLFKKRCPRNPVFGARDPGRKTFFLKDFLEKRPRFSNFSPAGQNFGLRRKRERRKILYKGGARRFCFFGWFLAHFLPARAEWFFFFKAFS